MLEKPHFIEKTSSINKNMDTDTDRDIYRQILKLVLHISLALTFYQQLK